MLFWASRTGPQLEFLATSLVEIGRVHAWHWRGVKIYLKRLLLPVVRGGLLDLELSGMIWWLDLVTGMDWSWARWLRQDQNKIIMLFLFWVNFPLVWVIFFSFVMNHYPSKSMLIQNRKYGLKLRFIWILFELLFLWGFLNYMTSFQLYWMSALVYSKK